MKKTKRVLAIIGFSFLGLLVGACTGSPIFAVIGLVAGCGLSVLWPVISPKGFRKKIKDQNDKNDELQKQINDLKSKISNSQQNIQSLKRQNEQQKRKIEQRLSVQQMKPEELIDLIDKKEQELKKLSKKQKAIQQSIDGLEQEQKNKQEKIHKESAEVQKKFDDLTSSLKLGKDIQDLQPVLHNLEESIATKRKEVEKLKEQITSYNDQINMESYGLYTPHYSFENSLTYKEKLKEIRRHQKGLIRNNEAGVIFRPMTLDGSNSKGHSMQKKNIKQLVRSFNVECEAAINKATYSNMPRIEKRIERSFDQLNKLNTPNGVELSVDYLQLKLDELHLAFEYAAKKEEEKEKLREEREKEREEKKAQAEIARKRKAVEKERAKQAKHFEQAQSLLKEKMANVAKDDEKYKSLQEEVNKLKAQLDDLDKQSASLDYRENHSTAGYVYIISNIGSFGKNIFKIGVTRRLEPLDRIRELSSASVPFKFDVHALIFSDDAYKLETNLHNYFDNQRVNKVNNRKEFFDITINQIKDALDKYYNRTFDFHEVPEAEEYRKSLEIAKSLKQ